MGHKKRDESKPAVGKSTVKKLSADAKPPPDKSPSTLTAQPGSKVSRHRADLNPRIQLLISFCWLYSFGRMTF